MKRTVGELMLAVLKVSGVKRIFGIPGAYDGPALVDVHTFRHEMALPPKLTFGQIKGFSLYATRTILSG